jgi:hypothetical protein
MPFLLCFAKSYWVKYKGLMDLPPLNNDDNIDLEGLL